jgi:hypothetical protein
VAGLRFRSEKATRKGSMFLSYFCQMFVKTEFPVLSTFSTLDPKVQVNLTARPYALAHKRCHFLPVSEMSSPLTQIKHECLLRQNDDGFRVSD